MDSFRSYPLLSTLSSDATFGEAFKFLLAGFAVVLITLLSLALVCAGVGYLFRRFPILAGKPQIQETQRRPLGSAEGASDPTVVAAIGAAVDQALGGRYRIRSVTPLGRR